MIPIGALLALAVAEVAPPVAPPVPSMIVSEAQFAAALPLCRDQLARARFDEQVLIDAGWPKAVSVAPDGRSPSLTTYRHPENMLLLTLIDAPTGADQCVIMVPFGPQLDVAKLVAQVSAFVPRGRDRAGGWPTWASPTFDVALSQMATAGAQVAFTKKGN